MYNLTNFSSSLTDLIDSLADPHLVILAPTDRIKFAIQSAISQLKKARRIDILSLESLDQDPKIFTLLPESANINPAVSDIEFQKYLAKTLQALGLTSASLKAANGLLRESFETDKLNDQTLKFNEQDNFIKAINNIEHEYLVKNKIINELCKNLDFTNKQILLIYKINLPIPLVRLYQSLIHQGAKLVGVNLNNEKVQRALLKDFKIAALQMDAPPQKGAAANNLLVTEDYFDSLLLALRHLKLSLEANHQKIAIATNNEDLKNHFKQLLAALKIDYSSPLYFFQTECFALLPLCKALKEEKNPYALYGFAKKIIADEQLLETLDKALRENSYDVAVKVLPLSLRNELQELSWIKLFTKYFIDTLPSELRKIFEDLVNSGIRGDYIIEIMKFQVVSHLEGAIKFVNVADIVFQDWDAVIMCDFLPTGEEPEILLNQASIEQMAFIKNIVFIQSSAGQEAAITVFEHLFKATLKIDVSSLLAVDFKAEVPALIRINQALLPQKLSASAIEKLMNNPYIFYAHYVLRLQPKDEYGETPVSKIFGIKVHDALSLALADFSNGFVATFNTSFAKSITELELDKATLKSWKIKGDRIARWVQDNLSKGSAKISEHYAELEIAGILLNARTDLIELEGNRITIADFKTGNAPIQSDVTWGIKPQLAIEGIILEHKFLGAEKEFRYLEIKGKKEIGKVIPIKIDLEKARANLEQLIGQFYQPEASFFDTLTDNFHAHQYGHLLRRD